MDYRTQLQSILKASGWSQEQLARNLAVSFVTLNSWVNKRSIPRVKAQRAIECLYFEIVGVDTVADSDLSNAKQATAAHVMTAGRLISDTNAREKLALHLTYHTNTIEGSTMTLSDVEGVIFDHKVLSNRTAVEQAEARNHQAALYWLLDELARKDKQFAVDEALILNIHLRLMNGIISDAGQYRTHAVRIMGAHVPLANWAKIPDLVAQLTHELNTPTIDIIALLAETHARFEQIHPFSDGNGRTGRLLMLAQALQAGLMPPLVLKERKFAYYKYLELAQTKHEYAALQLFIAESIIFTSKLLGNLSSSLNSKS